METVTRVRSRKSLVMHAPRTVALESDELPNVGPRDVLVRTECSLMSIGTEMIIYRGNIEPGSPWSRWATFPFRPGYAVIGHVVAAGSEVVDLTPGMRVGLRASHASHHVTPATDCMLIPESLPNQEAVWFALAAIAFRGIRASSATLGYPLLVVGAGPVGQMTVRWAKAAGANPVIVVDPFPVRLGMARAGGADVSVACVVRESVDKIREYGRLVPDRAIDTTGNATVLSDLLSIVPDFATIVLIGDSGRPSEQRLTWDVVDRGITLIGAHDGHERGWPQRQVVQLMFNLALSGRFNLGGLITHEFAPEDCVEVYAMLDRDRGSTMGVLFRWA